MARVTVEDCIEKVQNRFELVMVAAQRARKIGSGAALTIDRDNDKNPVVALREIAEGTVQAENLREEMVAGYQRFLPQDDEVEMIDLMDGEKEWGKMAAAETSARSGLYAEDDFSDEDEDDDEDDDETGEEPSLGDIAGV